MAMELTFTGWLNDVKNFDWGTVLKMSHSVRRKDEAGNWETVGKDFIDVIIEPSKRDEFAHALSAPVPCRMAVTGNTKPAHYVNNTGDTVLYMKVWANAIEVLEQDFKQEPKVEGTEYIDTPF